MAELSMTIKKRLLWVFLIFAIAFFSLIVRTAWIQLYKGTEYQKMAIQQWTREYVVNAKRGTIYDRTGKEILVQSIDTETVIASPSQIADPENTSELLASILNMDKDEIFSKITKKDTEQVYIKRTIEKEQSDEIREHKLDKKLRGIHLIPDKKRVYPNKNLASHVLGFTSIDGQGLTGIELDYNKYLVGIPGWIVTQTDAKNREIDSPDSFIAPKDYYDLILTIDRKIQYFAERELEKALLKTKSLRGSVIIMDPTNGDILAMANKPDYDPNDPRQAPDDETALRWSELSNNQVMEEWHKIWRNPAISDAYEPGSTFKIVTSVAGLEENVVNLSSTFSCSGYKMIGNRQIKCWRFGNPHGAQTFVEGVMNSCNPVFMETALRVGKDNFYRYIEAFGFGQKTGLKLTGEALGQLQKVDNVGDVALATISFGQGISVTPLQMVNAMSAIANGGSIVEPRVVRGVVKRDTGDNDIEYFKPKIVRRVISEQTSQTMRSILEQVVADGTGRNAYIEGFQVGGKTGTAQKVINGRYAQGKYIASFLAFAPADNPRIVVLVILDEPNVYPYFGGTIAAPVAQSIIRDTLIYMGVEPVLTEEEIARRNMEKVSVPEVRGLSITNAENSLLQAGLDSIIEGDGSTVVEQTPKPGVSVPEGTKVILYMNTQEANKEVLVPDLNGLTVKQASDLLESNRLNIRISGDGIAVNQSPEANTYVSPGTIVTVVFQSPGVGIH